MGQWENKEILRDSKTTMRQRKIEEEMKKMRYRETAMRPWESRGIEILTHSETTMNQWVNRRIEIETARLQWDSPIKESWKNKRDEENEYRETGRLPRLFTPDDDRTRKPASASARSKTKNVQKTRDQVQISYFNAYDDVLSVQLVQTSTFSVAFTFWAAASIGDKF